MNETLLGVPAAKAATVAGVTRRQLDYWANTDLVRPGVERRLSQRNQVRLYGFGDLIELKVVREMLRRGRSLQSVRRLLQLLRSEGFENPLRELQFATVGDQVYYQYPDGTWAGNQRPGQRVMQETLDLVRFGSEIEASLRRPESAVGKIERQRKRLGSKPVLAGTRIPVATVQRYLDSGYGVNEILAAFPDLTPDDVAAVRAQTA